jgi:hypothetical protein
MFPIPPNIGKLVDIDVDKQSNIDRRESCIKHLGEHETVQGKVKCLGHVSTSPTWAQPEEEEGEAVPGEGGGVVDKLSGSRKVQEVWSEEPLSEAPGTKE